MVTSDEYAYGVSSVSGEISGGEFIVTNTGLSAYRGLGTYGVFIISASGIVSGGKFTVTGGYFAFGIETLSGIVSGGEFTVTGEESTSGVGVSGSGIVSGGTFTVRERQKIKPPKINNRPWKHSE